MKTQLGSGQADGTNGQVVGRQAAENAFDGITADRVDFCQVFCSTKYEFGAVLDGVRTVIGDDAELFGCSGAGEFTEDGVQAGSVTVGLVASDTMRFFTSLETGVSESPRRCVFEAVEELPQADDPNHSSKPAVTSVRPA